MYVTVVTILCPIIHFNVKNTHRHKTTLTIQRPWSYGGSNPGSSQEHGTSSMQTPCSLPVHPTHRLHRLQTGSCIQMPSASPGPAPAPARANEFPLWSQWHFMSHVQSQTLTLAKQRLLKFSQTCNMTKWKWKEVLADPEVEQASRAQSVGRPPPRVRGASVL